MPNPDYLDPRWQKFRLLRLEEADWKCEICFADRITLHVHHRFYVSGRKPWEYLPETVIVLCEECHESQHDLCGDFENLGASQWEHIAGQYLNHHKQIRSQSDVR